MANRNFNEYTYSLEKKVVSLYAQVAIGATGAPTLSTANSLGIASIARNSAGKYTITLQDTYQRLMAALPTLIKSSGAPATSSSAQMLVRTDSSASATPTVVVEFVDNAGAAIELVSGVTVLLKLVLKNSTV